MQDGDKLMTTHVLAGNQDGHRLIIEIPPTKCVNCIQVATGSLTLVPHEISSAFESLISTSKANVCFLTHFGIDMYNFKTSSLVFLEPPKDAPKLNMGLKFYYPLPYVKLSALTNEVDNLAKWVREIPQFAAAVQRSTCPHILETQGLWTVFAPLNAAGSAFCYIFPGAIEPGYDGDATNLAGDIVQFKKGLPIGATQVGKEVKKSNGVGFTVNFKHALEPSRKIVAEVPCPPASFITARDIASLQSEILKTQKAYNAKVKKDLKEKLQMLSDALAKFRDDDLQMGSQLAAINHSLAQLVKIGRDL